MTENEPRIFLCHASDDKARVRELYHQLKAAGYHPWLDEEDLLPGQSWWTEIKKIISDPYNLVAVCLSCNSITKRGVVQREIKRALDVLEEMPEDTIYLIPARLEDCQVPNRLSNLHWVNLFEPDGFEKLKRSLDFEINRRQAPFEPEIVLIPAGEFLMGSDASTDDEAIDKEQPQHALYLPDYYLARTPVTNVQYAVFVNATNYQQPRHWEGRTPPKDKADHPVINVSWYDAMAYCTWLAEMTRKPYILPSEAEWEKGARGSDGRSFPWGNQPDSERCNSLTGDQHDTTPVEAYLEGASPYGLLDMAGNVWEWTRSLSRQYPYDPKDGREDLGAEFYRVLRGGSFDLGLWYARCTCRLSFNPLSDDCNYGFRVCVVS